MVNLYCLWWSIKFGYIYEWIFFSIHPELKLFVILNKEGEGRMIPFEMKSGIGMGNFLGKIVKNSWKTKKKKWMNEWYNKFQLKSVIILLLFIIVIY